MKVLMITPQVDPFARKGSIVTWISKLAERVDKLYVITLRHNKSVSLPQNVTVYGLDKESNTLLKFFYLNRTLLKHISNVDVVFCHMYPRFTIWIAPYAKLFKKPIITWYTHGHVSWRLKLAHFFANKIVTASKESFRIKSDKVIVVGHGIDSDKFKPTINKKRESAKKTILSVSRISPRKKLETLIKAADILTDEKGMKDLEFVVVGGVPMASQEIYYKQLMEMIKRLGLEHYVKFVGAVPYSNVLEYYKKCDVFVSTSQTGSLDKTVLEAMACEKPVITSNIAYYLDVFDEEMKEKCYFEKNDFEELASKIEYFINSDEKKLQVKLRDVVATNHSINHLVDSLVNIFKEITNCF